ncbi:MAG: glycosyltransferase [Planctomycetota bacterium]
MNNETQNGIEEYIPLVGEPVIELMRKLAAQLQGVRVLHINSTKKGGGVAEILKRLVPLARQLGIDMRWETVEGDPDFFITTKKMHNALQGNEVDFSEKELRYYEQVNKKNLKRLDLNVDCVIIHDPQPCPLVQYIPEGVTKIWRCHIDLSRPNRMLWRYLRNWVKQYDASIFHIAAFAQQLPHKQFLIPPSIDPLSVKNRPVPRKTIRTVLMRHGVDPEIPMILQVSRYDRFKDPIGVIKAFRIIQKYHNCQLVLIGEPATDDPEGAQVYEEVKAIADRHPEIHALMPAKDNHHVVNCFQRAATIIMQKSTREGFGLTVTEGMWKAKPVIAGAVGGITSQITDGVDGYLVNSVDGAAYRSRYLLTRERRMREMGRAAHATVLERFLITRHLRDYLALLLAVECPTRTEIEL